MAARGRVTAAKARESSRGLFEPRAGKLLRNVGFVWMRLGKLNVRYDVAFGCTMVNWKVKVSVN